MSGEILEPPEERRADLALGGDRIEVTEREPKAGGKGRIQERASRDFHACLGFHLKTRWQERGRER